MIEKKSETITIGHAPRGVVAWWSACFGGISTSWIRGMLSTLSRTLGQWSHSSGLWTSLIPPAERFGPKWCNAHLWVAVFSQQLAVSLEGSTVTPRSKSPCLVAPSSPLSLAKNKRSCRGTSCAPNYWCPMWLEDFFLQKKYANLTSVSPDPHDIIIRSSKKKKGGTGSPVRVCLSHSPVPLLSLRHVWRIHSFLPSNSVNLPS